MENVYFLLRKKNYRTHHLKRRDPSRLRKDKRNSVPGQTIKCF